MFASAARAMDEFVVTPAPPGYVPSPLDDGDGTAQFVVFLVCGVCALVGMKVSFDGEAAASEEALDEKVAAQVAAMSAAETLELAGTSASEIAADPAKAAEAFDAAGLARVDAAISETAAAELLAEVNATLDEELARAGDRGLPSDAFGNVYCKANRYDLKLKMSGAAERALREAVGNARAFLAATAGGENARLCEFAALVSDPGSKRQPVHPDTNYRRDRCVVTSFVALQDVEADMGPTVFIPGSHVAAPNRVATLRTGDASMFDSRLLHCGGGNASSKRRVLFYFSFEVNGSENPNSGVSSIRDELRGKYTLADL
jgi:ectoine hydroxylase-related dioxygenase (phytanoyl-CoA dioxygenase family)